jgi:predicted CoA-binding protein
MMLKIFSRKNARLIRSKFSRWIFSLPRYLVGTLQASWYKIEQKQKWKEKKIYKSDKLHDLMQDLSWIYSLKTVAIVGASRYEHKPAHIVPKYLKEKGYVILPVNPYASEIFGVKCYSKLNEISYADIVLMFRPSEEIPDFIPDIVAMLPKVLWTQLGIRNEKARKVTEAHNIYVVMNKCMMAEHKRIFGD